MGPLYTQFGSVSASAIEMAPRKPPHVNIKRAFFSKARLYFKTKTGMATEINLASSTMSIDTHPRIRPCHVS